MCAYHRVYLVKYATPLRGANFHTTLFVSRKPEPEEDTVEEKDPKGSIFDVQGPLKVSHTERQFVYDHGVNIAPLHTEKFRVLKHIGKVKKANIDEIHKICAAISPPLVPSTYSGEFPNCCDWIDNVLYQLHRKRIVEFLPDFQLPSEEQILVSGALPSRDEGSSSKTPHTEHSKRSKHSKRK